jgi:branched-chain amino acid transport system ATP-binding protein
VEENLLMVVTAPAGKPGPGWTSPELFPAPLYRGRVSGYLSGGRANGRHWPGIDVAPAPAAGRAFRSGGALKSLRRSSMPKAVCADEQGVTVLLVEQNAQLALSVANYGYIMERPGGAR